MKSFLADAIEKPFRLRVSAVVVNHDKVLITSHEAYMPYKGLVYDLPGGGVEPNQQPEDAVNSECLEEVGVIVTNVRRLDSPIHRAFFPVLKPGEGTAVQIERRKQFSGVESLAYFAEFVKTTNGGVGTAQDKTSWEWMSFAEAIAIMKKQARERAGGGEGKNVYYHMAEAIEAASKKRFL